jgi:hypothetical protein
MGSAASMRCFVEFLQYNVVEICYDNIATTVRLDERDQTE